MMLGSNDNHAAPQQFASFGRNLEHGGTRRFPQTSWKNTANLFALVASNAKIANNKCVGNVANARRLPPC